MSKSITKLLVSFATAICFTGFLGITTTRSQPSVTPENCLSLSKSKEALTIEKAIEDASKAEPCERSTNLIPIKDNPRLRLYLRMKNGKKQVLMVTLKGGCDPKNPSISCKEQGQSYTVPKDSKNPKKGLWVTAVPEVKEFVRDYLSKSQDKETSSSFLSSRLEQYLGLPPNGGYKYFVEVWVNKDDLIRPCSNSTVDDTTCVVPTPGSLYDPRSNTTYPFTGLGYTYDWGNSETDIGASEFIVKPGATVTIFGKKTTDEYLQGLTPHLQQK
jgi:hypothetical protein